MFRMNGMPRAQDAQERLVSVVHSVRDVRRDCVTFTQRLKKHASRASYLTGIFLK